MKNTSFHLILLAAGLSRRYGSNKLLLLMPSGKALYEETLDKLIELTMRDDVASLVVVTRYPVICEALEKRGISYIINDHAEEGIASSIVLGVQKTLQTAEKKAGKTNAYMFFVADQPGLQITSLKRMLDEYSGGILCTYGNGKKGNPVIFHEEFLPEILKLTGDTGGKQVIQRHEDQLMYFEVSEEEMEDIDEPNN